MIKIIKKAISKGFKVSSYDRNKEPREIREKEGNTMSWGIKEAITNLKTPPDIVYHKGGFGKEAMILIFGKNPDRCIKKNFEDSKIAFFTSFNINTRNLE